MLFGALFVARTHIYAVRWENNRAGRAGWLPVVRGGWRKGVTHAEREYLSLTAEVVAAHLAGQVHIGLCPLPVGWPLTLTARRHCWTRSTMSRPPGR